MPITRAEAAPVSVLRDGVLRRLAARRAEDPSLKVIDVGGCYKPWADEQVDAYVDLRPGDTGKRVFVGDICAPEVWAEIEASGQRYDISICSHVLEDVRDPAFVVEKLQRISRSGYVATPTKHTELSNVESSHYLGYCHHRWLFTARESEGATALLAVAKFPVVGYFNRRRRPLLRLIHLLGRWTLAAKAQRRLGVFPAGGGVEWVRRDLVGHDVELGVEWEGDLPFAFLGGDYAGDSCLETADLYRELLRDGV
ncbi:MAG: hypothetical protein R3325_08790 [Thermoanaerobaculia bacterium]|nr:hypothetical protein [Thermoanaerobaculia bacterium]